MEYQMEIYENYLFVEYKCSFLSVESTRISTKTTALLTYMSRIIFL